jgi:glycosyltransferase involved in cell wall biosynthesis
MDGIPVALMEAMAMGLPVVSTRVSGIPELVEDGHTGLLAPEKDAPALAAAMERLCREPELARKLGAAGRARVLERFDLRENVARLRDHLLAAAAGRTPPRTEPPGRVAPAAEPRHQAAAPP